MAKAKKKEEKKLERSFVVGLQAVYNLPRPRRANKAISLLKKFIFKHFRISQKDVLISNKLNEFIWQHGREHVPKKVEIKVVVLKGKANLFLKGERVKLPKEEKKEEEKAEKKEEKKTEEEKAAEEEKQKKKDEKKLAEKAAEKAAIKRGT